MLTIALQPVLELTDEQFAAICCQNPDLRLEQSPLGTSLGKISCPDSCWI